MEGGVRRRTRGPEVKESLTPDSEDHATNTPSWGKAVCWSFLASMILLPLVIWLIPSPIEPVAYSLPEPPAFEGPLAPNTKLQKAVRLFENQIIGPESMVADGDYLYTGTADGKIYSIYKGEMTLLAKLGKEPCGKFEDEPTCGRPLGMRMDKAGYLIVADCYLGLHKVNVATGDVHVLWPSTAPINGREPKFLNDLDIASDGTIFMSDSSSVWDRRHNRFLVLEGETTGRLLAYHPDTNTSEELATGIAFANGVQLSKDQSFVVVASTTTASLLRYNLQGPRKGKLEVFADNLPGLPDNIRQSKKGGFWVGFAGIRRKDKFSVMDFSGPRPWIRKLMVKLFSQEVLMKFIPKYGLIVHLNQAGEITSSLHDPTGERIPSASEVEDKDGKLYIGSYGLPYISRLNMFNEKY